jgi:arylsulfatase A-like enzyme
MRNRLQRTNSTRSENCERRAHPGFAALLAALASISPTSVTADPGARASDEQRHHVIHLVERRLLDAPDPRLIPRGRASIRGVWKEVFDSSKRIPTPRTCTGTNTGQAGKRCTVEVPDAVPVSSWALLEAPGQRLPGARRREGLRLFQNAGSSVEVPTTRGWRRALSIRPVPALEDRDVVVAPVVLPTESVLEFAIGVEEVAWGVSLPPLVFRILATHDGKEQEIYRRTLDPDRNDADRDWVTERVDLKGLGGRRVGLRFEVRSAADARPAPSLPLWGAPVVASRSPGTMPPSVVLISLDTLRARSMSTYGLARPTTPRFGILANRGTLFKNAFTTHSNTYGAHLSMLTGRYLWSTRIDNRNPLPKGSAVFLAERFREAGYSTAGFTENALLLGRAGFWNGFDTYFENKQVNSGAGAATDTFRRANEWVEDHHDRPFFLFVHTYQVHAPYEPPPAYRGLFGGDPNEPVRFPKRPTPKEFFEFARQHHEQVQRSYEQEVRYIDDLLGDFIDGLEHRLEHRPTLFVITSDHGEEFLEHGGMLHMQLYDEVLHIPLLMLWNGVLPAGRRIQDVVSLVDLEPTILSLVGIESEGAGDGIDLRPLLEGSVRELTRPHILALAPVNIHLGKAVVYAARNARFKCILEDSAASSACYDLVQDPKEITPLDDTSSADLADLIDQVEAYRSRVQAFEEGHAGSEESGADLDEETKIKLRALGYAE